MKRKILLILMSLLIIPKMIMVIYCLISRVDLNIILGLNIIFVLINIWIVFEFVKANVNKKQVQENRMIKMILLNGFIMITLKLLDLINDINFITRNLKESEEVGRFITMSILRKDSISMIIILLISFYLVSIMKEGKSQKIKDWK